MTGRADAEAAGGRIQTGSENREFEGSQNDNEATTGRTCGRGSGIEVKLCADVCADVCACVCVCVCVCVGERSE